MLSESKTILIARFISLFTRCLFQSLTMLSFTVTRESKTKPSSTPPGDSHPDEDLAGPLRLLDAVIDPLNKKGIP